jgi:hypothetical protein
LKGVSGAYVKILPTDQRKLIDAQRVGELNRLRAKCASIVEQGNLGRTAMRTDLYTKAMLTVIAACLVWLCLGAPSVMTPLTAQNIGDQRVWLAGWIDETGKYTKFTKKPLPVRNR